MYTNSILSTSSSISINYNHKKYIYYKQVLLLRPPISISVTISIKLTHNQVHL